METVRVLGFTAAAALAAVLGALPPAALVGYALARPRWACRGLVETLVTLPLALPPVATGLILLRLMGRRGPLGSFLWACFGVDVPFSPAAVALAMAVMAFPILVGGARIAFEGVPLRQERLARTLGCGGPAVFWRVELPLASRGLAAGAVLGYARALGEFGATITLAGAIPGRTETLASRLYGLLEAGGNVGPTLAASAAAACALVALSRAMAPRPGGRI